MIILSSLKSLLLASIPIILIILICIYLFNNNKGNTIDNPMIKRLYRLRNDRKIAGVCSGIADYFEIDPSIVRLVWILTVFFAGSGLFVYLIAIIVIPIEPINKQQ